MTLDQLITKLQTAADNYGPRVQVCIGEDGFPWPIRDVGLVYDGIRNTVLVEREELVVRDETGG